MLLKTSGLSHIITIVVFFTTVSQCEELAEISGYEMETEHPILAGESTPVFLARLNGTRMTYRSYGEDMVKKALDYLKSTKFYSKRRRSFLYTGIMPGAFRPIRPYTVSNPDSKQNNKFYYPSVLVVMEHKHTWPSNKPDQDKLVFEKILYALAYWNEVDNQLKRIKNPGVRIRIAAIIIGRNKAATRPMEYHTVAGFSIYRTLNANLQYWQKARNQLALAGGLPFNVVATMTDTVPGLLTSYGASAGFIGCGDYSSPETGHLINMTGLIVYDNFDFASIGQTLAEFSHIMGRKDDGYRTFSDASSFIDKDLLEIRYGLKNASCWSEPLDYFPLGKPVERLLQWDIRG